MNLPSEAQGGVRSGVQPEAMAAFLAPQCVVAPFEFRSLTDEDVEAIGAWQAGDRCAGPQVRGHGMSNAGGDRVAEIGHDRAGREALVRDAVAEARQEGYERGEQDGRRAVRAEMKAETQAVVAGERERLVDAVNQFRGLRERYFTEVEQEVVKLALAIAARVLHREVQIDPLLLTSVVRVALEKMADRSGVVLRVAGGDVEAWEGVFHATDSADRPRVMEDVRLERGDCVLETHMGTVELGVSVQLEEIEKGFFDLLNHRPVE